MATVFETAGIYSSYPIPPRGFSHPVINITHQENLDQQLMPTPLRACVYRKHTSESFFTFSTLNLMSGMPGLPQLPELPELPFPLPELPGNELPDFPVLPDFPWEDLIPPNQIIPDIDWGNILPPDFPLIPGLFDTTTVSVNNNEYKVPTFTTALSDQWLNDGNQLIQSVDFGDSPNAVVGNTEMTVDSSSWEGTYDISRVARASINGDYLMAKQMDIDPSVLPASQAVTISGSILEGSSQSDTLRGLGGWDVIDAKGGNDLVRGGNGRDIICGGVGEDELHGDFGRNTYTSQVDGFTDLIVVKSDQHLENWWYGTDGNSPNGEKADIIEGLDAFDQIKVLGVSTEQISFAQGSAHGLEGIAIYADGALEALYTGGNLSMEQLQSMTTGDNSNAAMNNEIWSYNFGNEQPAAI